MKSTSMEGVKRLWGAMVSVTSMVDIKLLISNYLLLIAVCYSRINMPIPSLCQETSKNYRLE